jgi:hypothetical protein
MRTVLIGSDFMYDKDSNLRPIEINTGVGWDGPEKVEDDADCFDLTGLDAFIKSNNFTIVHYIGAIPVLSSKLEAYCAENSLQYEHHIVHNTAITVPYVEDNDQTLIIRSSYDTTALVDDQYCRDKVNFMNLVKDSTFGSQFAYIDDNNTLVSNITTINDNGEHPNFILKSRYPGYDKEVYPKFFKVSNQSELDTVIENNVTTGYFLMEYLCNTNFLWEGHSVVIRSLNLLFPPNLESIQLGQYTKLNQNILLDNVTYNSDTFEVDSQFRASYNTLGLTSWKPKLLDTDMVEMSDGTFKTALDLQVGDVIKTIELPSESGVSLSSYISSESGLDYATLTSSAIYTNNTVTHKQKVNVLTFINELTFEDASTWEDVMHSKYLVESGSAVLFKPLFEIAAGDIVILIDTTDNDLTFVRKTVASNTQTKRVFSGWFITVDVAHVFLTKNPSSTNNESFVSVELNAQFCPSSCLCYTPCPSCTKGPSYCIANNCSSTGC